MSETFIRVQGDTVSRTPADAEALSRRTPDAPAQEPERATAPKGRVSLQYTGDGGEVIVKQHGPSSYNAGTEKHDNPLMNARNDYGQISADRLTPESIIEGASIGGSMRLAEALALGWARALPGGAGYEWVGVNGSDAPSSEQPAQEQTPEEKKPEEKPADPDVLSLSAESEAALADIASKADGATMGAVFEAVATGSESIESAMEALATKSGLGREVVSSRVEQIHQNLIEQFNTRTGLSEEQRIAFGAWAHEHASAEIMAAMSAHAGTGSLKAYAPLLAKWKAAGASSAPATPATPAAPQNLDEATADAPLTWQAVAALSADELRAAALGAGLKIRFEGGSYPMVSSREWQGEISLRDAVKAGILVIRG